MATIPGSKSGTRPYLELDWSVNSQDIANNRSSVNLKLYLKVDYAIGYSARYTGTLYGSSFTSSSGYISKPGRYLLTQRDVWIGHNSDGSKTVTLAADYNLNITWGGTYFGKITLSGSANLGTIPRASTLSAFSFNTFLQDGVANSIKYTVDRKSGNFRHHIQLRDGNTTLWTWDNQNTDGANTIALTAANVNTLLNRMSTVTSKTFTLRVSTRSGASGGWIGSAVSMTAKAAAHADVKPTVSALTVSQTGNSISAHYLQGKSKVKASFTRSAGYGATIKSSSITVRRKTSETDVQTINSNDGTTGKTVSLTGTYEARGITRDSRGRVNYTAWKEFTVTAYSSPRITSFTAARSSSTPTTVSISRAAAHTHLGGSNVLTYTVQRRIGTGSWTNVNTNPTGTSTAATFSGTSTSTGNSVTASYDFRMVVTDGFGESTESVVSVSTQRVVLDIHQNEGVGIGKIHEQGVLDVDGDAYFRGRILADRTAVYYNTASGMDFNDIITEWALAIGTQPNSPQPRSHWYVNTIQYNSENRLQVAYGYEDNQAFTRYLRNNVWSPWVRMDTVESGANAQGAWFRYDNGMQICWGVRSVSSVQTAAGAVFRSTDHLWTLPKAFINENYYTNYGANNPNRWADATPQSNSVVRYWQYQGNTSSSQISGRIFAIGWWKE